MFLADYIEFRKDLQSTDINIRENKLQTKKKELVSSNQKFCVVEKASSPFS